MVVKADTPVVISSAAEVLLVVAELIPGVEAVQVTALASCVEKIT